MPVAGVEGDTDVLKHRRCVVTCRPAAEREGNVGKTYGLVQGSVAHLPLMCPSPAPLC